MSENNDKNIHGGHRERMRRKYIENGLSVFREHEILEMLLYYSYHPRLDTNVPAHRLLNAFGGSLINVFNATPEELMKKGGVSEKVAVQLSMISDLAAYYIKNSRIGQFVSANSFSEMKKIVFEIYATEAKDKEVFHMLALKNIGAGKVLDKDIVLGTGTNDHIDFTIKDVVEAAISNKVKFVVIAHNHPGGTEKPSEEDIKTTKMMKEYLEPLGIRIIDHIIVCGEGCYSFAEHRIFSMGYTNDDWRKRHEKVKKIKK